MLDVAVIGAGFAGLSCAQRLASHGQRVAVLEKAPRLGGRLATLVVEGQTIDCGAPFFVAQDAGFRAFVDELIAHGVSKRWTGRLGRVDERGLHDLDDGIDRFICPDGMPDIGRFLARDLDLRLGASAARLELSSERWTIHLDAGETVEAAAVVLALPTPVATQLLETLPPGPLASVSSVHEPLARIEYDPIIAAISMYESSIVLPTYEGIVVRNDGPLEWIGVDSALRADAKYPALVIHGWGWWSREMMGVTDDVALSDLLFEAGRILGDWVELPRARHLQRWRFAGPAQRLDRFWLATDAGPRLGACGDFGPVKDLEGAWRSGVGLAAELGA